MQNQAPGGKGAAGRDACVEDALGLSLSPDKTQLTTFGQGFVFLGYDVSARTIRMGGKAEERFKRKSKALTRRSHNLDAEVVMQVNRVIRGTVRYFATAFTSCLGQFNALDRWIRMRIRCMKYKRIWKTDNRRLKRRHIRRMGVVLCREVYVSAKEGEDTDSSQGAMSWGPPGARKTHAGKYGETDPMATTGRGWLWPAPYPLAYSLLAFLVGRSMEESSSNKRASHQPKPRRERTMAQLTPTAVCDAIVTANETFMAAFSRRDAAALAASYTKDGQLLPPHSDIITGKQAIEAFWQSVMDMGITQIKEIPGGRRGPHGL